MENQPFSRDDRPNRALEPSVDSASIVHSSSQIANGLRQASSVFLDKAKKKDDPSQSEKWLELSIISTNKASDIEKSASEKSALEKSEAKKVLEKILSSSDPSVRKQLLNFYPILIANQEQVRQNGFLRKMTVAFFSISLVIGTGGAVIEAPIFIGAGLFLLGASVSAIVPDYVLKVIDKWNTLGVSPKIPSKGDDNLNIGDNNKDEDSSTEK